MTPVTDSLDRPLRKLRLSVTDRCNLRCSYCMPRQDYTWLPRADLLDFSELSRLTRVFTRLGVERLRLTGGEPLLRRGLPDLVEQLTSSPGIRSVALTTNGTLLQEHAASLYAAGLQGVTVSLDTLRPERFAALTSRDDLAAVLAGIDAARSTGFVRMKLNTVVMRGCNDDELSDLVEFARTRTLEPRFIEYMDVGGAVDWRPELVVSRAELLARIAAQYGPLRQLRNRDGAPADRFALTDGFVIGVISSTTEPFCARCDRARLTADGMLLPCLYARSGLDVRALLRAHTDDHAIQSALTKYWSARSDRGAVQRLTTASRGPLLSAASLLRNPHLEMHTRGG